jgi:hypothetical protein
MIENAQAEVMGRLNVMQSTSDIVPADILINESVVMENINDFIERYKNSDLADYL